MATDYVRIPIYRETWRKIGRKRKEPGESWDDVIRRMDEKAPARREIDA